jgi:hypothetical protein
MMVVWMVRGSVVVLIPANEDKGWGGPTALWLSKGMRKALASTERRLRRVVMQETTSHAKEKSHLFGP